jgi:hypothetical protein
MQFWDLFQWWNLIFTLPFGVGLLPLLLQALGASHFHHSGHVPGHHLHHLGHAHLPTHHPAPGSHTPATAATHARAQVEAQEMPSRVLTLLGVGKAPVMLVFSIFCLIWGATGVAANQIFARVLRAPTLYVWLSALCALVVAYLATGGLSQWISRLMPDLETNGTDEASLVGRIARAAYELGAKPGSAFLLDDQQNRIQVRCRTHNGLTTPGGAEVLLLDYDAKSRIFTVVPIDRETTHAATTTPAPERTGRPQQKIKLQ